VYTERGERGIWKKRRRRGDENKGEKKARDEGT
jgi:hypothetical protein